MYFYTGYNYFIICYWCNLQLEAHDENLNVHCQHKTQSPECGHFGIMHLEGNEEQHQESITVSIDNSFILLHNIW